MMLLRSYDVRHVTDESLAPFQPNRRRLPRKQRQDESSSKANRQLVKRIPPLSSGRTGLRRCSEQRLECWSHQKTTVDSACPTVDWLCWNIIADSLYEAIFFDSGCRRAIQQLF
ncbi:unnamed protein product [Protopolystoma xenopodis]|uniref:Uncharacterized protein n=1 Tax=Protopolystoma xenopodis TaxID=117903 RepID=A0A3S5C644_9PLAT|nr:unnamed protein product [Protopolystoma xenopodis]